jgi:geranylgeranyl reductase family protein
VSRRITETDVRVVGCGPGGAAAAYHLARHGVDVTVVDRATFPREKVCGDGLTPRSVAALERMGVDVHDPRFEKVMGLRVYSRETMIELPWPELRSWPDFRLVMPRWDFDAMLAERAAKGGATVVEGTEVLGPIIEDGWVRGGMVRAAGDTGAPPGAIRAKFVISADGAASRFASAAGVKRDDTRPLGIAARRYYRTDYDPGGWLESWLDLWDGDMLLPGYGWLFPVNGGRINVGAGLLSTFKNFKDVSARRLFDAFVRMLPASVEADEDTADGVVRSGPLPMGLNRLPLAVPGMLLVGDAGGAVNPFNGEGIAYAIETAEVAAELINEALVRDRPGVAMLYPTVLQQRYGRYFSMGNGFANLIGNPRIMGPVTKHVLPNKRLMTFAMRILTNLSDGKDGDAQDRLFHVLERMSGRKRTVG